MADYTLVLERLLNTPLLAHPDKALTVAGVVLRRQGVEVNVAAEALAINQPKPTAGPAQEERLREDHARDHAVGWERYEKPYILHRGVAVIEVTGSLAHREFRIGKSPSGGITGYDGIGAQFDGALADPEVAAIYLDCHSPGGEVHGCFQLADRIFAARGVKPIVAVADEMAYSGAYALAAACDELWLASETAGCGSIGSALVHFSLERMIKADGVKPTLFQSGARKLEGNPLEDLAPEAIERFQAEVDNIGRAFERRVAAWRKLSANAVRGLEAACFTGQEAVDLGLADGIAPPQQIFNALAAEAGITL
jgi:ClpP class serine protease